METQILSDICIYRKGKVLVSDLTVKNYISTENLLPNKGGLVDATSLPTSETVQVVYKDDVLISNIRPYFKKIWQAREEGGCSSDVLVFVANVGIDPTFLYYVLANDRFFEYSMASSKGTKMPRGDKRAIMQYKVPKMPIKDQIKIARMLRNIDDKIQTNNKINRNLSEQVTAIYKSWFIDFDRNNGECPKNWSRATLGDIAQVTNGKRPPMKQNHKMDGVDIPLVGATSIMGYTNAMLYDSKILVAGRVGTHGVIQRFNKKCWPSDNTLVITTDHYEFVNQVLLSIDYKSMNRGSTQPLITQGDLRKTEIILPTCNILDEFETLAGGLMDHFEQNEIENIKLIELRDTLIPKLMSGELDISKLEI